MKKLYSIHILLLLTFLLPSAMVAQNIDFPDANFKQALLDIGTIDTNIDNEISEAEAASFSALINVANENISDLTGIEYFITIPRLECNNNQLSTLDVSACDNLLYLDCSSNQLTDLNVSGIMLMTELYCSSNQLTTLDVSSNMLLGVLDCSSNELTGLDISNNIGLGALDCSSNALASLDLTANETLITLDCSSNELESLDLTSISALESLDCDENRFPFSELYIIKNDFALPTYTSSKRILDEIFNEPGFELDYSAEHSFDGQITAYTWYNAADDTEVDASFVEDIGGGMFRFLQIGTYYCVMTNAYFPGTELTTNVITIAGYIDIPDANFKAALLANASINTNADTEISIVEAQTYTGTVDVSGEEIADLTGIDNFINIIGLDCSDNALTSLDISANTSLTSLMCNHNRLLFSALYQIRSNFTALSYVSSKRVFSAQTQDVGYVLDRSGEAIFDANETVYTWYKNVDDSPAAITDIEALGGGQFTFLMPGEFYCVMTNPLFTGTTLTTEVMTVEGFVVTFVDWDGTVLKTEGVAPQGSATAPNEPVRKGYDYTGWDLAFNNVNSNLTVEAEYDIVQYSVTYNNMDGASNAVGNPSEYTIETPTVTLGIPTKANYDFGGWFDDEQLTQEVTAIGGGEIENITLWAMWTLATDVEQANQADVKVYPIPMVNDLNISGAEQNYSGGAIYSLAGKLLKQFEINEPITTISVAELEKGVYILQLSGEEKLTLKVVKY